VDFRNTLIVMTSNLGSEFLVGLGEGEDVDSVRDDVMAVVRSAFRPEFLNRVDEIVIFHRLNEEDLRAIVDIQLDRLARVLADRGLTVELTDAAKEFLASRGWDPIYGARPLKRAIQTWLQNPLAVALLEGRLEEGDHVLVDVSEDGEELKFERAGEPASAA
jgi:ATP-dependent Clp protease ATP-binding subunit ClpB